MKVTSDRVQLGKCLSVPIPTNSYCLTTIFWLATGVFVSLRTLTQTPFKIDCNQGLDANFINEEVVKILARIKWLKYIRFSCDSVNKLPYFVQMAELFRKHGISLSRVFIYVLVRKDLEDADYRVQELHKICKNFNLYAQAERNPGIIPTEAQLEFAQRYVYGRSYKKENCREYCVRLRL